MWPYVNVYVDTQVWYLIVSIPDLCTLTYFADFNSFFLKIPRKIKYFLSKVFPHTNETTFLKNKKRENIYHIVGNTYAELFAS